MVNRLTHRIRLAAVLFIAIVVALSVMVTVGHSEPSGTVIRAMPLVQSVGDMADDSHHGYVLVPDDVSSPGGGTQPGLRVVDAASGRMIGIVLLQNDPESLLVDESSDHVFALTGLDRTHPFGLAMGNLRTGMSSSIIGLPVVTALPVPSQLPHGWANGGYGSNGPSGAGSLALDKEAGHIVVATRQTYYIDLNGKIYPDTALSILSLASRHILHIIRLSDVPSDLALDPTTHQAFVIGAHGELWIIDTVKGLVPRLIFSHGFKHVVLDPLTHRAIAVGKIGLRVLDTRSGQVLASMSGSYSMAVLVGENRVVVASPPTSSSNKGSLRLVDVRTGRGLWERRLAEPVRLMVADVLRNRLVVATCTSPLYTTATHCNLEVLSSVDGDRQREIQMPATMEAMVIDEATGHLFVRTQGAPSRQGSDLWTIIRAHLPTDFPFLPQPNQPVLSTTTPLGTLTVLNIAS